MNSYISEKHKLAIAQFAAQFWLSFRFEART